MRQIKFRGLKVDSNELVYGSLVNNLWTYSENHKWHKLPVCEIITDSEECSDYEEMQANEQNVTVDPNTVGQFTGQKDVNGKEIYENDIVMHGESIRIVEYRWSNFSLIRPSGTDTILLSFSPKCYVIGNIHQNPELLS